jgi:hypothetical protein
VVGISGGFASTVYGHHRVATSKNLRSNQSNLDQQFGFVWYCRKQNTIVFQGDPESVESAKSKLISIAIKHVNKETTSITVSEQLFDEVDLHVRGLEPCCEEFLRVDCDGPEQRAQDLNVTLVVNEEGQTEYT